ncbi:MAG TPA: tRNA (adenosine(37)-N6)-dimethylallyltransferase MiaA [Bacteroidia bacterium]|nr:tRNA (adenosine(37)-N6)-dimethylallyltransferase MiaA [Bacteroidia bacterium]HRH09708.1 tRNA (adenosine(37)-N6)-dimethylallyltransferase MiaA [Bacteroidia bacterium]HRH62556.1 tRNA (adenosine(37)-N6)-dimethylallyltransferase MiaA [Bacteroidia bacterium]
MQPTLLLVCGPTAVGKTALAIELAKKYNTEIISSDSRQIYREMNIGTARPTAEEMYQVPHHLIGHVSIHQNYTVADFEKEAHQVAHKLFQKHNLLIMVGGSGLYCDAFCNGLDELPESQPEVKSQLMLLMQQEGISSLQKKLEELDPEYYQLIDKNNPHRLIRAIEVCLLSGKKFSELRSGAKRKNNFRIIKIGLQLERSELYERINSRVLKMMESGLLKEAKSLEPFKHLKALKTVGYSELFDCFENKMSLENAVQLIQQNTRRYAKRQLTWFRKDNEINWINNSNSKAGIHQIDELLA